MFAAAVLSPSVLAQAASIPDSASTVAQATPLLVGIMALSVLINQALGAFNNFRKLKGADPLSTAATDATDKKIRDIEQDMRDMELRIERRIGEHLGGINTRLQNMETTLSRIGADFNRSLGRLEGKAESEG